MDELRLDSDTKPINIHPGELEAILKRRMAAVRTIPGEFDLLVSCPVPLRRNQLLVDFSPAYDRELHPDVRLEQSIDKVWEDRLASQPSLFSATKFRYAGCQELSAEVSAGDSRKIILRLGLTDYKTFVGTNLSPDWERFLTLEEDDVKKCRYTASPLGNGAIVETVDHQILILQRSMDVGEFPGFLVFPGGHSEPAEIGIKSHLIRQSSTTTELLHAIGEEMFDGIIREIEEETGVSSTTLSDPVFLGVSRRRLNARPTAFFFVTCSLSSAEVRKSYDKAQHSFESTVLLSTSPEALTDAGRQMPGCHHGGVALYQMMRDAHLSTKQQLPTSCSD